MTELKTLKDMRDIGIKKYNRVPYDFWISENKLKAEAVKCAKYFLKQKELANFRGDKFSEVYWTGRFDEAMERNNLTEEDLK